jgi:hypothetical protein
LLLLLLLLLLPQMVTGSRAWAGMSHMAVVNAVCCDKIHILSRF